MGYIHAGMSTPSSIIFVETNILISCLRNFCNTVILSKKNKKLKEAN
jgi:hypothetical protein